MWNCMKLRHLEELLQSLDEFKNPKILLEQYITPPHLSSHILHTIQSQYGDFEGKFVGDLGSGCGALAIGAAFLDAAAVLGFEIDDDALEIFNDNLDEHELTNVNMIKCDILKMDLSRWENAFDTIIMNPPFGTKHNSGIDMKFLEIAFKLSKNAVYSLHKTSTRAHVLKVANKFNISGEVLAELRYDIPNVYKFHKKGSVDIQVDFFRFQLPKNG